MCGGGQPAATPQPQQGRVLTSQWDLKARGRVVDWLSFGLLLLPFGLM